jgi:hypothetical protein
MIPVGLNYRVGKAAKNLEEPARFTLLPGNDWTARNRFSTARHIEGNESTMREPLLNLSANSALTRMPGQLTCLVSIRHLSSKLASKHNKQGASKQYLSWCIPKYSCRTMIHGAAECSSTKRRARRSKCQDRLHSRTYFFAKSTFLTVKLLSVQLAGQAWCCVFTGSVSLPGKNCHQA